MSREIYNAFRTLCKERLGKMFMDELWSKFYLSGKIIDYLEYKRKQGGQNYVDSKRPSDKRTAVRG